MLRLTGFWITLFPALKRWANFGRAYGTLVMVARALYEMNARRVTSVTASTNPLSNSVRKCLCAPEARSSLCCAGGALQL